MDGESNGLLGPNQSEVVAQNSNNGYDKSFPTDIRHVISIQVHYEPKLR